jgi:hypothetical protein
LREFEQAIMVQYRAEYMVGGTKWVHRKMIESTRELGSFMLEDGSFSTMERISERTSEIRSKLHCLFGKAGVKGRDERKERALDTVLPKQTPHPALFPAKDPKKSLDKADAVIHGATVSKWNVFIRPKNQ